jgi:hypothetical protein
VSITSGPPTQATQGVPYSFTLTAQGGSGSFVWSQTAGTMCSGLTLASTGIISGTPTAIQTCSFTATVADANNPSNTANAPLQINVQSATTPLRVQTISFPTAFLGIPYGVNPPAPLTASGGVPPYTWDVAPGTGSLPPGLAISGSGINWFISGIPSLAGTYTFSPRVTDSVGTQAISNSPLNLIVSSLPGGGSVVGTNIVIPVNTVTK